MSDNMKQIVYCPPFQKPRVIYAKFPFETREDMVHTNEGWQLRSDCYDMEQLRHLQIIHAAYVSVRNLRAKIKNI